ncbi:MAG: DNA cytosine methyltransferase [Roseburia inulinivorans]|jgi:DNA (cytosine-5)-methyltransferase 1|uniref:DNA (cytosine-5-)-methyltransferase n=2 Tax=Roseburia inulinivorans TaxID=360807 RepID=A0A413TDA4_9FIRM|nr:DNA cytosine methyltransferase [Roseburia sp.]MBD9190970.1 DNA cytosine methyltransferase [Roseburia inulinivorans]RHA82874.1 DNA cytosine methyltransferase [Roseburia inulinivorans]
MIEGIDMELRIFSFFSGAGFLDLGFEKEKYEVVFVNEYSNEFLKAYKFAREKMGMKSPRLGYYCGDINDLLRGEQRKELEKKIQDMKKEGLVGFVGGPPCPDFSIAGKNEGISGKNGMLTNSYKRIIIEQEPDFFIFENVKGLWSTQKHRKEYDKIKEAFRRKGYILVDKLVNALDYGVPQDRERVILFGIKYNLVDVNRRNAVQKLKKKFDWGIKEEYKQEVRKKCEWPETSEFNDNSTMDQPTNIIPELCVEYWFEKNDVYRHYNATDFFQPRSTERFESIQEGDVSKKSFKRLHRWRYSPTAAYGNNEVHLHPYYARRLSVAEALAIQSLPKEYVITKDLSKSDMFKTVGNGVPFLLAKEIAHSIRIFLENELQ